MKTLLILLILGACTDPAPVDCGPPPTVHSFAWQGTTWQGRPAVVMTRADLDALVATVHDAKTWAECLTGDAP